MLIFILLALGSCDNNGSDGSIEIELLTKNQNGQAVNEFALGENISFELTLRNKTKNDYVMNFADGGQFGFHVLNDARSHVWLWGADINVIAAFTQIIVRPDDLVQKTIVWDQMLSNGENIPPGRYIVEGAFKDQSPKMEASFIIK